MTKVSSIYDCEVSLFIDTMHISLNSDVHCNMLYERIGKKIYLKYVLCVVFLYGCSL